MMKENLTVEAARAIILDSCGRVDGVDISADRDIPPVTNSVMEGYTLQAVDTAMATADDPVRLPLTVELLFGRNPEPSP
jgi:molybdopterin biosynthesis enzyme